MLMIRLQRVGRRNHAEFRLVATEKSRAAKSSNYVEHLGHYNPHTNTASFNTERVLYWIENGAQVSDTVHNLLVGEEVIKGEKKNVLPKKSPIKKAEDETAEPESTKEEAQTEGKVSEEEKEDEPKVETLEKEEVKSDAKEEVKEESKEDK